MKMTRRIFIALLIVSVFFSVFAITASAAAGEDKEYDYVLEYFEEPVLFDYDFTGEDVSYDLFMNEADRARIISQLVTDETSPVGKYLSITVPASSGFWEDVTVKNNVYFNWNAEDSVDDFILEMTVSGSRGNGEEKQLPKIIVSVADETCTDSNLGSSVGVTMAALDFRAGCFAYLKASVDVNGDDCGVYTNTTFAVSEDAWYNVYIAYTAETNSATITVTDITNPSNTYVAQDAYLPYDVIKNVRVGAHGVDGATARDSEMKFASLRGIGGKYDRDPADLQMAVENALLDMHADFVSDSVSFTEKEYISEVAHKIFANGFVTEDETVLAAYNELIDGVAAFVNNKLAYYIATHDTLATYDEKRALVDEALTYVAYINSLDPSAIPEDIADDVAANLELVSALDIVLQKARDNSIALISAVGTNTNVDYDNYQAVVARFNELHVYGQYADATYEGALDAYVFYATLLEAKQDIELNATRFIESANVLNSDEDFNTRAQAFLVCKNNFYENSTYPGLSEAVDIYNFHYNTINTQIEYAENFIKFVNKADYADYVPQKLEHLAEAEMYMYYCLTSDPYAGVLEAKELYDKVKAEVEEKVHSANLYIEAVNALSSLTGDALAEGIATAQSLKTAGNVLGVDGVTEANIKLDEIVSNIQLSIQYRDHFVKLVDSIDDATTAEQLYKILRDAKEAEKHADRSYESVVEASEKLASAVADYNKKAEAANKTFEKANEVAAVTCGIGKDVNPIADHVIALIKKFFDEE